MHEQLTIPDDIIHGAQFVMEHARDVRIHSERLQNLAERIAIRLDQGIDNIETAFGTTGVLERDVNLVFFETVVNFCFWADTGQPKWMIERDGVQIGGWYSLAACFDRAITHAIPVYDASFMANLTYEQARELFAGVDATVEIPLLKQRVRNLNQAGSYLRDQYQGEMMHLLESVAFSAPRLAEKVATEIASFRDGAHYDGQWIWILKRAQILGSDLSQLTARYPEFVMHQTEQLTAFADYRLPHILRHYGVLTYSTMLDKRVLRGNHIEPGEPAEVEIRAATIQCCEMLKQSLPHRSSADIDVGLWLLSQDMRDDPTLAPHHRTLGQFY